MNWWLIVYIIIASLLLRFIIDIFGALLPKSPPWKSFYAHYGFKGRVKGKVTICPMWIGNAFCQFGEISYGSDYFEFGFGSRYSILFPISFRVPYNEIVEFSEFENFSAKFDPLNKYSTKYIRFHLLRTQNVTIAISKKPAQIILDCCAVSWTPETGPPAKL